MLPMPPKNNKDNAGNAGNAGKLLSIVQSNISILFSFITAASTMVGLVVWIVKLEYVNQTQDRDIAALQQSINATQLDVINRATKRDAQIQTLTDKTQALEVQNATTNAEIKTQLISINATLIDVKTRLNK